MQLTVSYVFLIALAIGCSAPEEEFDTQYLPEGVERSTYQYRFPNGENFQGARIDPPFWWTGMVHDTLQLLIYDREISDYEVAINYRGITVLQTDTVENPNYLFATLHIASNTRPGKCRIQLMQGNTLAKTYLFELKPRVFGTGRFQNVNAEDIIYLIMPDRFANGDPSNDSVEDMRQTGTDRSKMYFRHGGDIQGIIDHLDDIEALGVTALWLNPVQENDQPYASYHGYAITDHYRIDPRLGDNALYQKLAGLCQLKGMKLIMDIVPNHTGDYHWFVRDIPAHDWIHQALTYMGSNHSSPVLTDPHASDYDKRRQSNGWFDVSMPDLNQRNPFVAEYLIQNAVWWIEYAGIDAYRIDTYPYADQAFMAQLGRRILKEYPDFYFFGETWVHEAVLQAHFTDRSPVRQRRTYLPGVTDFQLNFAIKEALTVPPGYNTGVYRIQYALANDFLYQDPNDNVIFLDNHDMDRFYAAVGEDFKRWKCGIALLMTLRGIPCVYYGTELLLSNRADPDGKVRQDFPGGWPDDPANKFTAEGRTELEERAHAWFTQWTAYRKRNPVLSSGQLTQFAPEANTGVYVFFRHNQDKSRMIVFNSSTERQVLRLDRYRERLGEVTRAFEPIRALYVGLQDTLGIDPLTVNLYEVP